MPGASPVHGASPVYHHSLQFITTDIIIMPVYCLCSVHVFAQLLKGLIIKSCHFSVIKLKRRTQHVIISLHWQGNATCVT